MKGLDLLPGKVVRFQGDYKVPHMGWNQADVSCRTVRLFEGLEEGHVYFVHSYPCEAGAGKRSAGDDGLLSAGDGDCRPRQCVRHAVPSRRKAASSAWSCWGIFSRLPSSGTMQRLAAADQI